MSASHRPDYTVAQKVLHWLMALAIMMDLVIAQKFGGVMEEWDRFESRSDHASVGTVVAVLFVLRLLLRLRYGAPPLPADMPAWQKPLAHLAHWALYLLIGALIVTGVAAALEANSVIAPFGLFALNGGVGDAASFQSLRGFHELATDAIIALILFHVVAALYHAIFVRDGVTRRMLRFWSSAKS